MNYHSDQWIMDRVQEHYNEALESFPKAFGCFTKTRMEIY